MELRAQLADPDPMVRAAAVEAASLGDANQLRLTLTPLLRDPARQVRIEAGRALAGPPEMGLSEADRPAFRSALDEYIAAQRYNSDRGEAHMNLALLEIRRGNGLLADDHLERAILADPTFVPAYAQLADLYRARREEQKAEAILRRALDRNPDSALGLPLPRPVDDPSAQARFSDRRVAPRGYARAGQCALQLCPGGCP